MELTVRYPQKGPPDMHCHLTRRENRCKLLERSCLQKILVRFREVLTPELDCDDHVYLRGRYKILLDSHLGPTVRLNGQL